MGSPFGFPPSLLLATTTVEFGVRRSLFIEIDHRESLLKCLNHFSQKKIAKYSAGDSETVVSAESKSESSTGPRRRWRRMIALSSDVRTLTSKSEEPEPGEPHTIRVDDMFYNDREEDVDRTSMRGAF